LKEDWNGWGVRLEWIKQMWWRKLFKVKYNAEERWEGPESDRWKM
jgi:hypothetical protein